MKFIKSLIFAAPVALLAMAGCNSAGDKFDYDKSQVYITGTESSPIVRFQVEDTPSSFAVTASSTHKAASDVTVSYAVDYDALEKYNKEHGTTLNAMPQANFNLSGTESTIKAGTSFTSPIDVTITSTEGLDDALVYVIPISITKCNGLDVLEPSRTILLQVARTIEFNALNMSNTGMYSNFIFDEPIELSSYTYEVKFYSENWHSIARLMNFCEKDEANQSMFRFGEGGYPVNSLQWVTPSGVSNMVTNTTFDIQRWYTLSVTYDGSNFALYVDGNKDCETSGTVGTINFQRIELGMSWGGYRASQYFRGRMCEMRVWDHARTPGEIKNSLCGVDPQSEGLVAYWKFNEGQGYIFNDATGHGYTMDWKDTSRDVGENGVMVATPDAANAVSWIEDDKNKCSE